MPTAADLIATTRRHVYGSDRQALNALKSGIGNDDTTIALSFPNTAIQTGASLACGLEVMYVWSVDPVAGSVTVQRGWNGSPQSTHDVGDLVTVNPRFSDWDVLTALNDDLQDLSSPVNGLYQVVPFDFTAVSGREGYDFESPGFQEIIDIRWQVPNDQTQEWRPITDWTVDTVLPTDTFPSGTALFLNGYQPTAQQTVRVKYKASLGSLGNLDDDVAEVTGLPTTAMDLPPMGAALRIMAGRPIARAQTSSQGDTRRAAEVTVNDVVQAPAALRQIRQNRIVAEAARLGQLWPQMTRSRDVFGRVT